MSDPAARIPRDAGVWAPDLMDILSRIPPELGRRVRFGRGWYPIIARMNERIVRVLPSYEITTLRSKNRMLKFYWSEYAAPADTYEPIDAIVREAEAACARTCERCGEPGLCRARLGPRGLPGRSPLAATLCSRCAGDDWASAHLP
jgi:hypothetical protein